MEMRVVAILTKFGLHLFLSKATFRPSIFLMTCHMPGRTTTSWWSSKPPDDDRDDEWIDHRTRYVMKTRHSTVGFFPPAQWSF